MKGKIIKIEIEYVTNLNKFGKFWERQRKDVKIGFKKNLNTEGIQGRKYKKYTLYLPKIKKLFISFWETFIILFIGAGSHLRNRRFQKK